MVPKRLEQRGRVLHGSFAVGMDGAFGVLGEEPDAKIRRSFTQL